MTFGACTDQCLTIYSHLYPEHSTAVLILRAVCRGFESRLSSSFFLRIKTAQASRLALFLSLKSKKFTCISFLARNSLQSGGGGYICIQYMKLIVHFCIVSRSVSALQSWLMLITANPGRSGSKQIESRPHWCTNTHTHGAAKHMTIQKWRRLQVCFVHRQLPKFPIDIFNLVSCTLQSAMVH